MAYTDAFYLGDGKKRGYFEGWYFKHRKDDEVFSAIPGMCVGKDGQRSAFLQLITSTGSHFLRYPYEAFAADSKARTIRVGSNVLSPSGALLDIKREGVRVRGELRYGPITPLRKSLYAPGIMGPFCYLSFMECYHGVLSLHHDVWGRLEYNGKVLDFDGGTGYIEKDFGRSFPSCWLWYQSGSFSRPTDCVMLAVARIPFLGLRFPGILCVCVAGGEEYRLATYYGARLTALSNEKGRMTAEVAQGGLRLLVEVEAAAGQPLMAPVLGDMRRTLHEAPSCESRVQLLKDGRTILSDTGRCAGFEWVGDTQSLAPKRARGQCSPTRHISSKDAPPQ